MVGTHASPFLSMVAQQADLSKITSQLCKEFARGCQRRVDEPSKTARGAVGAKMRVPTAHVAPGFSPMAHSSCIQ